MRVGFTLLISAVFFGAGAPASHALMDPATDPAANLAAGTTGAQSSTSCPTPKLKGLPKSQKFTNATIHFKVTNVTPGAVYVVKAGETEVRGGTAAASTFKGKFPLPNQGTKDHKVAIAVIIDAESCNNAPWKLEKHIAYKAINQAAPTAPAAPTTPAPPPAAALTPARPVTPTPARPVTPKPAKTLKPPKLPESITQRSPDLGPPPSRRTWLTPLDGGARLDQKLSTPVLGRLERPTEKAKSSNALLGLGIVAALLAIVGGGGFLAFRRRDDVQFERAMTDQLKHLEEGDPGMALGEDPDGAPFSPPEQAPFAGAEQPATEPLVEPVQSNGATGEQPVTEKPALGEYRAEVEAELQRILNEAGLEAELEGILTDARAEAERHGITLDPDLMLQALCEEINGSARLSDTKRAELRSMFAGIIAEEAQQAPASAEKVPTQ